LNVSVASIHGTAVMPSTPIFVFECVDDDYVALTKQLNGLRHLNAEFCELRWLLRQLALFGALRVKLTPAG
jgi:hypothetical protein